MKLKKYLILVLAISLLLTAVCMFTATAEEETATPEIDLKIYAKNLALENSIYVSYAVPVEGTEGADSIKMLFWLSPQDSYVYGTQTYELIPEAATSTIGGKQYYVFEFDKLAAKQMTVDIYARVYATDGENEYYSKLDKYSILQYAYNKLGKTSSSVPTATLKNLLNDMLTYGARAQEHFGTNLDRLANANYYQVKINGATLSDGADHGLYPVGTLVNTNAPEKNENGEDFLYWQNSAGEQVGEELTYTITVGEENETYTAVYGEEAPTATDESYFIFTDLSSFTCSIAAKDVNNMPAEVVIPSTYNGKTVTMIAPRAFFGCSSLTSIVIPDSVTGIGDSAFYGCAALSSAPLPNTLTSIGDRAFEGCVKLANIVIPNGVTSIGEYAFLDCHSFTEITVPSSVTSLSHAVFYYCVGLTKVTLPNTITSIESFAFANCYELTDITIPSSVVSIGDSAFLSCISLTSVVIPGSVTYMGGDVFYGCASLTIVTIPNSLTQLNGSQFENCTNLTSVVIPTSIKTIYGSSFEGTALEKVYYCGTESDWANMTVYSWNPVILNAPRYYYSETQPTIEGNYWHYVDGVPTVWEFHVHTVVIDAAVAPTCSQSGLTEGSHCSDCGEVLIAQEVVDASHTYVNGICTVCGEAYVSQGLQYALSNDGTYYTLTGMGSCTDNELIIPETYKGIPVIAIAGNAFSRNNTITSLIIPDSVTEIKYSAFCGCKNLTNVDFGSGLKEIGSWAFDGCDNLKKIILPDGLLSIGEGSFGSGYTKSYVIIPNSVTEINYEAFDYVDTVYCEMGSKPSGWSSDWFADFNTASQVVWGYYSEYVMIDGLMYGLNGNNAAIVKQPGTISNQNLVIPETIQYKEKTYTVTWIKDYAFSHRSLSSVVIPDTVISIGNYAFEYSYLSSITLSKNLVSIGASAFAHNSYLSQIVIPSSVTSINQWAFADCTKLTIYCEASSRPSGWNANWNGWDYPVVWGYSG